MPEDEGHEDTEGTADKETGASTEVAGLRSMLARYKNDALATAAELYSQTYTLREERRKLRQQVKELEGKLPKEGSVILSEAEAKAWETYQKLGKPEEVVTQLDAAKKTQRELLVSKAAKKHGFNETVLNQLLGKDSQLVVEAGKDGEEVFKVKAGDKATTITELVESDWKVFQPSLVDAKSTGNRAVGQAGAREGGKTDYVGDYLSRIQPGAKEGKAS